MRDSNARKTLCSHAPRVTVAVKVQCCGAWHATAAPAQPSGALVLAGATACDVPQACPAGIADPLQSNPNSAAKVEFATVLRDSKCCREV